VVGIFDLMGSFTRANYLRKLLSKHLNAGNAIKRKSVVIVLGFQKLPPNNGGRYNLPPLN